MPLVGLGPCKVFGNDDGEATHSISAQRIGDHRERPFQAGTGPFCPMARTVRRSWANSVWPTTDRACPSVCRLATMSRARAPARRCEISGRRAACTSTFRSPSSMTWPATICGCALSAFVQPIERVEHTRQLCMIVEADGDWIGSSSVRSCDGTNFSAGFGRGNVPAEAPQVRLRQPRRFLEMCAVSWHPGPSDMMHPNLSVETAPLSLRGERRYGPIAVRAQPARALPCSLRSSQ